MKRSRLIQLINDPYILSDQDTFDLEREVDRHNCCQITQVLLALAYYRTGDSRFTGSLKKAASSIPSRKRLRVLFSEPDFIAQVTGSDVPADIQDEKAEPVLFQTKEEIIQKFIREEPKISRPKGEFFNPNESAFRSNVDEDDIVSETLARLYAKQGNTGRAIKIYEKLSLLIPEKSRYFAAQIENLKEK